MQTCYKDAETDCNSRRIACGDCNYYCNQIKTLNICWSNGTKVLKERFKATIPGLIYGVQHVSKDIWKLKLIYKAVSGNEKAEITTANTAYACRNFGEAYVKFATQQQN